MAKLIKKIRARAESAAIDTVSAAAPVKAAPVKGKAKAKAAAPVKAKGKAKAAPVKAKAEKPLGKRAELLALCEAGKIPAAPDFSAATHSRFRKRLAEITALVKARNIKGLKAARDSINPISTSPKAMVRYATHAIIAIEAAAKAGKRKAA